MKKILLLMAVACSAGLSFAQSPLKIVISTGTTVVMTNSVQATFSNTSGTPVFTNDGSWTDNIGKLNDLSGLTFTGSGTTSLHDLGVNHASGTTLFNSQVSVYNTATLAQGNLDANNFLHIRSDAGNATMVNNGSLINNVQGLVAKASATTGGCPSYASNLSLNISGTQMAYQWQTSPTGSNPWSNVAGATNETYAATVTEAIYYRCSLATKNTAFTEETPAVQLNFTGTYPTITLGANPSVIQGTTTADLPYSGTTGSPDHYNITYDAAAHTAGFTDVTFATLPPTQIVLNIPGAAAAAVYNGTVTVTNGCVSTANPFTVSITAPLVFNGGDTQPLPLCENAGATSINTLMAISDPGVGLTEDWTVVSGPAHGSLVGFPYSTTSGGGTVTPVGLTYQPGGSYTGPDAFTIQVFNGSATATTTINVTVNPNPTVNAGSALSAICQGGTTTTLDGAFGGGATGATWTDGGAGGSFTNNDGTDPTATTYTASASSGSSVTLRLTTAGGSCGTTFATKSLTVNPNPTVNAGSALSPICQGGTTTTLDGAFGGGATGATWADGGAGGTFTLNDGTNPAATTYTASASSGSSVTLTLTTAGGSCGTTFATKSLTVNPNPTVSAGGALSPICQGGTTDALGGSFGGGATGATWTDGGAGGSFTNNDGTDPSATTYTASASSGASVTLTLTTAGGSCGTTFATKSLTVNPNPTVSAGGALSPICQGGTTTALGGSFGGGATGATWTDGSAGGSFTNNDGTDPAATTYTASASSGSSVTLTLTTAGGACSTIFDTKSLTVNPNPTISVGSALADMCQGATSLDLGGSFGGGATAAVWSDGISGGSFSNNGGGTPGIVAYTASASAVGTVTLTLTTSGGSCGSLVASKSLTINANPTVNVGSATTAICQGAATAVLGGSFGGGATAAQWTDGGAGGTFNNNGGATPGITTYTASAGAAASVTLTLTTSGGLCGTVADSKSLTVNPTPVIDEVTNMGPICAGTALDLSSDAHSGSGSLTYAWTGPNAYSATGKSQTITAAPVAAEGTYTLIVSDVFNCAATGTTTAIVYPTPVIDAIGNNAPVCEDQTLTLFSTVSGGTGAYDYSWAGPNSYSSIDEDPTVATNATTLQDGTYYLTVTDANNCTATGTNFTNVTVYPIQPIVGPDTVLFGQTITLSDPVTGGTWATPTPWITGVAAGTGVVKGTSAGTSVISYTTAHGCVATYTVTVISGVNACVGQTISLSDNGVSGGTWTSSNASIATIGLTTGLLKGIAAGKVVVTYRTSAAVTTTTVTVNPLLPINMTATNICQGQPITLTNLTAGGGVWYSGNTSVAVVTSTGIVTPLTGGVVDIYFTPVAGCAAVKSISIISVSPITGIKDVCVGQTTMLSNITPGGVWNSNNAALATITPAGMSRGVAAGRPVIYYTWPNGCWASTTLTVNPLSLTTTSTGIVCEGVTIAYANTTMGGGVWSSDNTSVATVGATGLVTGAGGGAANILFTTGAGCVATKAVTVNPTATILGLTSVCVGQTVMLSSTVSTGNWYSSSGALATVNTAGVVKGVNAGAPRITFITSSGCVRTVTMTVNYLNATTGGTPGMCQSGAMTLANSTPFGGVWSSSNTGIATVNASGVVRGAGVGTVSILFTTTSGGCVATRTVTVNACREAETTSIVDAGEAVNDIRLFPNPNNGSFSLQGTVANDEMMKVEIFTMLGQSVYSALLKADNGRIDANISIADKLARGSYMLRLTGTAGGQVFHFVVN